MRNVVVVWLALIWITSCATPFENEPEYRPAVLTAPQLPAPQQRADNKSTLRKSLADCLEIAWKNHRSIRMADRRILIAKDDLDEAWTPHLPTFSFYGQFEARQKDQKANFMGNEITLSEQDATSCKLSAQLLLYDFGRAENLRDSIRARIQTAELNADRVRQNLTLAVSQAYFQVLTVQKTHQVVEESCKVIEEQLSIARDFFNQGLVHKSDVLSLEVAMAERQQELIHTKGLVEIAHAVLNRLLGINIHEKLLLEDVEEAEPWQKGFLEDLQGALAKRPDLLATRRQLDVAQSEYRALRANFAPRIFAYSDYQYSTETTLGSKDKGRLVGGVGVQFSIFDGGVTYVKLQRKEKEIAEAKDAYEERADDVALEVKRCHLQTQDAGSRVPVAKKSIELAEENLRIMQDRYRQGLATSADVLLEEDRLSRSRMNYYQALYDYHQAFAQLLHAIGGKL